MSSTPRPGRYSSSARRSGAGGPPPPALWAVIDEGVLRRRIGSAPTMRGQLLHLLDVSERSTITIQVVPAEAGAHVGLLGAFFIAAFANAPSIVYLETPDQGQIKERRLVFDTGDWLAFIKRIQGV